MRLGASCQLARAVGGRNAHTWSSSSASASLCRSGSPAEPPKPPPAAHTIIGWIAGVALGSLPAQALRGVHTPLIHFILAHHGRVDGQTTDSIRHHAVQEARNGRAVLPQGVAAHQGQRAAAGRRAVRRRAAACAAAAARAPVAAGQLPLGRLPASHPAGSNWILIVTELYQK